MSHNAEADASPLSERLVAYLDGELSRDDAEALEAELASDVALRDELARFDRVWNALDVAPRETAPKGFAGTTVAMVAAAAQRDLAQQTAALPAVRRRVGYAALGVGVATALVGFLLARGVMTRDDRQLVADLTTIEHAAALREAGSAEFLRRLAAAAPGLGRVEGAVERAEEWTLLAAATPSERAAWVSGLDDSGRQRLAERAASFRALSPPSAERLRRVVAEVAAAPDAESLRATAAALEMALAGLSAAERAELEALPEDERVERVRGVAATAATRLNEGELRTLREAAQPILASEEFRAVAARMAQRAEGFAKRAPQNVPGAPRLERFAERLRAHPEGLLVLASMIGSRPRGGEEGRDRGSPGDGFRPPEFAELERLWPQWREPLVAALPERVRSEVERASAWRGGKIVAEALREALAPVAPGDESRYFGELELQQQQRLLAMPVADMQRELRELVAAESVGMGEFEPWRGAWRGGGGPEGRRPGPGGPRPPFGGPPPRGGGRFGPPPAGGPGDFLGPPPGGPPPRD